MMLLGLGEGKVGDEDEIEEIHWWGILLGKGEKIKTS